MECKFCGTINNDDFKFCSDCGKQLNSEKCKYCGEAIEQGKTICTSCGEYQKVGYRLCPTCNKEISNEYKHCPYCGERIQVSNSINSLSVRETIIIVISIVLLGIMVFMVDLIW